MPQINERSSFSGIDSFDSSPSLGGGAGGGSGLYGEFKIWYHEHEYDFAETGLVS
jgi:hypothetical protein